MPDPARVAEYAKQVRKSYEEAERTMLDKVARRLERGLDTSANPGWAEKKLAEVDALGRDMGVVTNDVRRQDQRVVRAIGSAYQGGVRDGIDDLRSAGLGEYSDAVGMTVGSSTRTLINATVNAIESSHLKILRAAQDVYRDTITEASEQVLIGTETRREAAQRALNRLADKGITGLVDAAGRNWDLASYAEMAVRTATGHASTQGYLDKMTATGHDLVIVSAHGAACRLCGPWEGRVLSITGATPGYPTVAEATAAGLFHPNCRHRTNLYIEGLTRPNDEHPYDPIEYEAEQHQREIERHVRHWKKREAVALDDQTRAQARLKVRQWQSAARKHAEETGVLRKNAREQVRVGKSGVFAKQSDFQATPTPTVQGNVDMADAGSAISEKFPILPRVEYSHKELDVALEDWFDSEHGALIKDISRGNVLDYGADGTRITDEETKRYTRQAEVIQNAAVTSKSGFTKLYRGIPFESQEAVDKAFQVGSETVLDSLTASTSSKDIAMAFTDLGLMPELEEGQGARVLLHIENPTEIVGVRRSNLDEVVLPKGSRFTVEKRTRDRIENDLEHVYLKSVDTPLAGSGLRQASTPKIIPKEAPVANSELTQKLRKAEKTLRRSGVGERSYWEAEVKRLKKQLGL